MSAYAPKPVTQTVGEKKKREVLSSLSYWQFVIFGIGNRTEIRRDCVGSPVFGVFPVKAGSQYRQKRQILPKSQDHPAHAAPAFREHSAGARARASWALVADPTEPDIAAGFRHQVREPVRVSWAPVGLLTFVEARAGFREQACAASLAFDDVSADSTAKVFLGSHRACAFWGFGPDGRRKPAQTRSRIDGAPSPSDAIGSSAVRFPLLLSSSGLTSWGGIRRNAFERLAAARRELVPRRRR